MIFEQGVYRLDVDVERTGAFYEAEPGICSPPDFPSR